MPERAEPAASAQASAPARAPRRAGRPRGVADPRARSVAQRLDHASAPWLAAAAVVRAVLDPLLRRDLPRCVLPADVVADELSDRDGRAGRQRAASRGRRRRAGARSVGAQPRRDVGDPHRAADGGVLLPHQPRERRHAWSCSRPRSQSGIFARRPVPWFTYAFGIAAVAAIAITSRSPSRLPAWSARRRPPPGGRGTRAQAGSGARSTRSARAPPTRSRCCRTRPVGVARRLVRVHGVRHRHAWARASRHSGDAPGFGVFVFAYLIGQLGG